MQFFFISWTHCVDYLRPSVPTFILNEKKNRFYGAVFARFPHRVNVRRSLMGAPSNLGAQLHWREMLFGIKRPWKQFDSCSRKLYTGAQWSFSREVFLSSSFFGVRKRILCNLYLGTRVSKKIGGEGGHRKCFALIFFVTKIRFNFVVRKKIRGTSKLYKPCTSSWREKVRKVLAFSE